jgi:hypothetical protein
MQYLKFLPQAKAMWQLIQNSKSHSEGIFLALTNTFPLTLSAAIVIAMTPRRQKQSQASNFRTSSFK